MSTKEYSQIAYKNIPDFGHPLSNWKWDDVLYKERHPLLLECFITFLRCIRKMEGAADSICEPLKYGSQCAITSEVDSQTGYKIQDLGTLSTPRRMGCCTAHERRHPTSITAGVFHKLPYTYKAYVRTFRQQI